MPKNVELLDNTNDILYPRTKADQVNVGGNKNLTQKLNEIDNEFNNYLPLTGGTLTGDLIVNTSVNATEMKTTGNHGYKFSDFQGGWYATDNVWIRALNDTSIYTGSDVEVGRGFYLSGHTKMATKPNDNTVALGDERLPTKILSSINPTWNNGVTDYNIITSNGGTVNGDLKVNADVVLSNGKNFKTTRADGIEVNALGMDGNNRLYLGSNVPLTIQGSEVYCSTKATFAEGMNIDNNKPIFFKKQDGTPMSMITYANDFHVGETQTRLYLYGNGISVHGNMTPDYGGTVQSWDLGWDTSRWGTVWCGGVRTERIFNDRGFLILDSSGGSTRCNGTFAPTRNNAFHLGVDALRWQQVWTINGVMQGSDANIKEDIREVQDEDFFNMIKDVEVKSYLYKEPASEASTLELVEEEDKEPRTQDNVEDNDLNVGIIAQEMAKHDVSKYVLNHSEEGGYSINLYNYSASLHSALRHEIKKREELEERVAKLEEIISKQATTLL